MKTISNEAKWDMFSRRAGVIFSLLGFIFFFYSLWLQPIYITFERSFLEELVAEAETGDAVAVAILADAIQTNERVGRDAKWHAYILFSSKVMFMTSAASNMRSWRPQSGRLRKSRVGKGGSSPQPGASPAADATSSQSSNA